MKKLLDYQIHFTSFAVAKINGELIFQDFQRRYLAVGNKTISNTAPEKTESSIKIIKDADSLYGFRDFDPVLINTTESDDHFGYGVEKGIRILNYCTRWDHFIDTCPDYTFDTNQAIGYGSYDTYCDQISVAGIREPKFDKAVWRGNVDSGKRVRSALLRIDNSKILDCANTGNNSKESEMFMSLLEQVSNYKFLINVSSYGYSKRLKYMMFSRRPILLVDRDYKEWFWQSLIPFVHYVPVNRDLSDLEEKILLLKDDQQLSEKISNNAYEFAIKNLRYENALERFNELLNIQDSRPNRFEDLDHKIITGYCREND